MRRIITMHDIENLPRQTRSGASAKAGYWLTKAKNCKDQSQAQQYFHAGRFWLIVSNLLQRPLSKNKLPKRNKNELEI